MSTAVIQLLEADPDLAENMAPRARAQATGLIRARVFRVAIGWAEHVLADGHRGKALREYCVTTTTGGRSGCSTSFCPTPRTASRSPARPTRRDPVAGFDLSRSEDGKAIMAYSTGVI